MHVKFHMAYTRAAGAENVDADAQSRSRRKTMQLQMQIQSCTINMLLLTHATAWPSQVLANILKIPSKLQLGK